MSSTDEKPDPRKPTPDRGDDASGGGANSPGNSGANSPGNSGANSGGNSGGGDPILDTRERLIESAQMLFLEHGYHATGIKQILRASDANSGSLYHYFPTKEDLLLAVLDQYVDLLWPIVIRPVFDRITDPIERIFGVLDGYRRMLQYTSCKQGCPIGNLALELSDSHENVRELVALNFTNWKKALQQCLDEAEDRLPDHVDRVQLASFILTVMEGGVMQARAYKSLEPFESAVALLRDYFDHLLAETADWSPPRSKKGS